MTRFLVLSLALAGCTETGISSFADEPALGPDGTPLGLTDGTGDEDGRDTQADDGLEDSETPEDDPLDTESDPTDDDPLDTETGDDVVELDELDEEDEPFEDEDPTDDDDWDVPGYDENTDGSGRMTGGGSVWLGDTRVTHGFNLRCETKQSDNLQINWEGHSFHATAVDWVDCIDDPALQPGQPSSSLDTLIGRAFGRLDGVDGATVDFLLTDDGEPGWTDESGFDIVDVDGNLVISVVGELEHGNHQAHGTGMRISEEPAGQARSAAETGDEVPTGCSTTAGTHGSAGLLLLGLLGLRRRS